MNLYPLLRPLLFSLDAETAHHLTLEMLKLAQLTGLSALSRAKSTDKPRTVMGMEFKNPLGLAAGLAKNGDSLDTLADLGFGFIDPPPPTRQPQASLVPAAGTSGHYQSHGL